MLWQKELVAALTTLMITHEVNAQIGYQVGAQWPSFSTSRTDLASTGNFGMVVAWTPFQAGDGIYSDPVIDKDGNVFFGSDDGKVYKISGASLTEIWTFQTGDIIKSSPAIDSVGNILIGSMDEHLYNIDGNDGSLKWKFQAKGSIVSSPVIGKDGNVYVGSSEKTSQRTTGQLFKLNYRDGTIIWEYALGSPVDSTPTVDYDGNVFLGSVDTILYKINGIDGTLIWVCKTDRPIHTSPVIDKSGNVYITSVNKLYKINGKDGSRIWELFSSDGWKGSSPAIDKDENVLLTSEEGELVKVNGNDGSIIWVFKTGGFVYSAPSIDKDGHIFLTLHTKNLFKIRSSDGKLIWRSEFGYELTTSPAIDKYGGVFVGSSSKKMYKFKPACDPDYYFDPTSSSCEPMVKTLVAIDRSYQVQAQAYVAQAISRVEDLVKTLEFPKSAVGILDLTHYSEKWLVDLTGAAAQDQTLLLKALRASKTNIIFGGTLFSPLIDKYADDVASSKTLSRIVLVSDGQGSESYKTLASKKKAMKKRLGKSAPEIFCYRTRVHSYGSKILKSICDKIVDQKLM